MARTAPGIGRYPSFLERAKNREIDELWKERVAANARKRLPAPGTHSLGPQYGKPSARTASYARG